MEKDSILKWKEFYLQKDNNLRSWPDETLVRILKGPYLSEYNLEFRDKKVLDVGFGNGESFIFLKSLGFQIYGTEVDESVCHKVQNDFEKLNIHVELTKGLNQRLPFPDNYFDYLISWNVLHYENNETDILKGLAEYNRVLKPNGRMFLSTTGPNHKILKNSTKIENHIYLIGRDDDIRKGQIFYYFDSESEIRRVFSESFHNILVGRTQSNLFSEDELDWFLITATKNAIEVKTFILEFFAVKTNINTEDLACTTNYFEMNYIDSLGIFELISTLENEFQCEFNENDFQDNSFSTINGLTKIIENKILKLQE